MKKETAVIMKMNKDKITITFIINEKIKKKYVKIFKSSINKKNGEK